MAIFRYPGGKSKLLKPIKEMLYPLLEKSDVFAEPFVGGGSVLIQVAKDFPDKKLYVNDKDERMAAFWEILSGKNRGSSSEIDKLCSLVENRPTVTLFKQMRQEGIPEDRVGKAYHAVFFNRCTFSGIATAGPIGGYGQKSKYRVDCRYNSEKIKTDIRELAGIFNGRLVVKSEDVISFMDRKEIKNAAVYLDPPYYVKGSALYPVHMQPEEHKVLSEYLKNRDKWVLSYDICDEIGEMYNWAEKISLDARYSINGKDRKDWVKKKEFLIRPYEKK